MNKSSKKPTASAAAPTNTATSVPDMQSTLAALRAVRNQLYAMPGATVASMAPADQIKYGDNLQQLGTNILKLETLQLQQVNQAFVQQAPALQTASMNLQHDVSALSDSVKEIQTVNAGLGLITNIVGLLK